MIVCCVGTGIPAGAGIAIGAAHRACERAPCARAEAIDPDHVEREIARFDRAVAAAAGQLREIRARIPADAPAETAEFIDTHLLMLEDGALRGGVETLIRERLTCAEWALQAHCEALVAVFEEMRDSYLRTRRDDLLHVVGRIQQALAGEDETSAPPALRGRVIVSHTLSPADLILLHDLGIAGFVTEGGSPLSHTAILARSLGVPGVIGAPGATTALREGERLVLDADSGCVFAGCPDPVVARFRERRAARRRRAARLRRRAQRPACTRDGVRIRLLANIELPADVAQARAHGADGVGLYRTEFLYMNRETLPDEDEQLAAYRAVVEGLEGRPVTLRTLDLGADKHADDGETRTAAALGLRAIRLCLKEPALFRTQLRAILRASAFGPVRLLLPLLTRPAEVDRVRVLLRRCMAELESEGHAFDPALPVGGMIEVPGAALAAAAFARRLDFLSIGTNDLIQYTLAVDRGDREVAALHDPLHPGVLQLIAATIEAGARAGIPVAMCGEMAGEPRHLPLLLGMGLEHFSMPPSALPEVRDRLRGLDRDALRRRVAAMLRRLRDPEPPDVARLLADLD